MVQWKSCSKCGTVNDMDQYTLFDELIDVWCKKCGELMKKDKHDE